MNLIAKNISVDAGMIIVADLAYRDLELTDKNLSLGNVRKVLNGKYKVHYSIKNTWNGPVEGDETLLVTNNKIIIIDPCYIIGTKLFVQCSISQAMKSWMSWLEKTSYGKHLDSQQAFIIDSMGGDGCYNVHLSLQEIK